MSPAAHFVYCLVDGGTPKYVGYTAHLKHRRAKHHRMRPSWAFLVLGAYQSSAEGYAAEVWWIERLRRAGLILENISDGGLGRPPGLEVSLQARARIIAAHWSHGPKATAIREKLSTAHLGKTRGPHSAQTRTRISVANKGKRRSPEARVKNSEAHMGKTQTPETRAKISLGLMRHLVSGKTRAKIGKRLRGNPKSETHRANLSASLKGRPSPHCGRVHTAEARSNMSVGHRKQNAP